MHLTICALALYNYSFCLSSEPWVQHTVLLHATTSYCRPDYGDGSFGHTCSKVHCKGEAGNLIMYFENIPVIFFGLEGRIPVGMVQTVLLLFSLWEIGPRAVQTVLLF